METWQGKHFSITDPEGVNTVIYQINKTPKEYLKDINHLLVWHGRNTCIARKPNCENCCVKNFSKHYKKSKNNNHP